jgi:hypothetical protein
LYKNTQFFEGVRLLFLQTKIVLLLVSRVAINTKQIFERRGKKEKFYTKLRFLKKKLNV